ncbi:hypothetical protein [Citrobacter amalonaticus]|uniref:hypothetical protein n=1 Tax=Citrobacter amalonaticus TaxID=35703 RepID=UPI001A3200FF|nr:hypothetical protein [Citrobacter amalonaticus]HDQ2814056.1 hypothetical protein [Citrobacter amalonaticus]
MKHLISSISLFKAGVRFALSFILFSLVPFFADANNVFERSVIRTVRVPATVVVCGKGNADENEKCICYRKMCYRQNLSKWDGAYSKEAQKAIRHPSACTAGLNGCPEVWLSKDMVSGQW